jgi:hypothetical protein
VSTSLIIRKGIGMKLLNRFLSLSVFIVLISGCQHYMPLSVGMTKQEVVQTVGQPDEKWIGGNGIECWKYIGSSYQGKGGTWFMIFKNGESFKIIPRGLRFSSLEIGLPEAAVIAMLGNPYSVSATESTKYINYLLGRNQMHYVRIVDGFVESYGRVGDFDSTKVPEQTMNVNLK